MSPNLSSLERYFAHGLRRAHVLSEELNSRVVAGAPPLAFRRSMRRTVLQLKASALRDYQSALVLLENAFLARSAESLVRCIVEDYSHLHWIVMGEDARVPGIPKTKNGSPRCLGTDLDRGCTMSRRALCLEFGLAGNRLRNVRRIKGPTVARRSPEARQLTRLQATHTRSGCAGVGRDYKDVGPVVDRLHATGTAPWARDLYVVASEMVHGVRRELLSRDPRATTGDLAPDRLPIFLHANATIFSAMVMASYAINGRRTTDQLQTWLSAEYATLLKSMHLTPAPSPP